jgi:hypothetical protein
MIIGLYTSVFFNNIGNAFIDLGAEQQIKASLPDGAQLVKLSQCANFSASLGRLFDIKYNPIINWIWAGKLQKFINRHHDSAYTGVSTEDVFSPFRICEYDYIIIPGCVLTLSFFKLFGKVLEEKVIEGSKLIFWAASGNYYSASEIRYVKEWLNRLKPYAISFRDSMAFEYYSQYSNNIYNGIDNVFFVNLLDIPLTRTTQSPYYVVNFDSRYNAKIKNEVLESIKGKNVVMTDHEPYPYRKIGRLAKQNVMCSDYPLDYLYIYRNTERTYSDRVHACIPTLSFGNEAQLFSDSPRISLFENVGIDLELLKSKPITLDKNHLKTLQNNQIAFLKSLLV